MTIGRTGAKNSMTRLQHDQQLFPLANLIPHVAATKRRRVRGTMESGRLVNEQMFGLQVIRSDPRRPRKSRKRWTKTSRLSNWKTQRFRAVLGGLLPRTTAAFTMLRA